MQENGDEKRTGSKQSKIKQFPLPISNGAYYDLKMAVAMASCSLGVNLNSNCSLKKPLAIPLQTGATVQGSFGFGSKSFFIVQKGSVPNLWQIVIFINFNYSTASSATAVEGGKPDGIQSETDKIPIPKVIIDQDSDPNATVVEITFGDRLGALLDTMSALRNLGLNVVKANVYLDSSGKHNKFAITRADTGRKVEDPELLEAIRLTIINNLIEYHPESSSQLAMGAAFGIVPPPEQVDVDVATHISISDDGPNRSLLYVESADRPGLLVDLVKTVTDIDVAVESGEFDTEGLLAKAKFHVSYRGKPLIKPLQQVLANSLRYYLRRPMTEEGSF
ncbi:uridylyltransferase-related protein [Prunus dulcis]|uniref:ACT domain-containing protein ACR n=1 Tax=Prunus dulcis TaxID=3755 RepID=A0A5H2XN59_PRUDU|nr:uridylyltransferase-related protein [Prunus dulcis]